MIRRVAVARTVAMILATIPAATPALADTSRIAMEPGTGIDLALSSSQTVRIEISARTVRITAWSGGEITVATSLSGLGGSLPEIHVRDIDRDGIRDLAVPTEYGYGGVNIFHTVLLARPGTQAGWSILPGISNPSFDTPEPGLRASARSGPTWVTERWDVAANGRLFLRMSQSATFMGFDARTTFTEEGRISQTTIVPEAHPLHARAVAVHARIGARSLHLGDARIAKAHSRVRLIWYDAQSASTLIETEDGELGWTTEELSVETR